MTTDQKQLIKATVPILREHGVTLTAYFYQRMFKGNPELKHLFNMGNQQSLRQQTALATAVLAYAENIDDPLVLLAVVDAIGHKHTSLDIRPEHYAIVGKHLIASIAEVLGDVATENILDAWKTAYGQLATLMSGYEARLYSKQIEKEGGWTGWRPFMVKRKEMESDEITSFYLYPTDGGKIAGYTPGQYISLRLFLPELQLMQPRQYSISCAPNGTYYRISVKREKGSLVPDGMISNRLHDSILVGDLIDVSAPAGNFMLEEAMGRPVVFISGGVGQTPLLAMLEHLIENKSTHSMTWIHGCRGAGVHAFRRQLEEWQSKDTNLDVHVFYDIVSTEDNGQKLKEGSVNLEMLGSKALVPDAVYYLCGPAPFIKQHYHYLTSNGVIKEKIRFEEFGPASLQLQ